MDKLLELAERCEAAAGPSRELDNAVEEAIDFPKPTNPDDLSGYPPYFTASLDAAMTLVPEGANLAVRVLNGRGYAGVDGVMGGDVRAATLPLAICAAALRARASQ